MCGRLAYDFYIWRVIHIIRKGKGPPPSSGPALPSTYNHLYLLSHLHRLGLALLGLVHLRPLLSEVGVLAGNYRTVAVNMVDRTLPNIHVVGLRLIPAQMLEKVIRIPRLLSLKVYLGPVRHVLFGVGLLLLEGFGLGGDLPGNGSRLFLFVFAEMREEVVFSLRARLFGLEMLSKIGLGLVALGLVRAFVSSLGQVIPEALIFCLVLTFFLVLLLSRILLMLFCYLFLLLDILLIYDLRVLLFPNWCDMLNRFLLVRIIP
jgi:hypothetical protein